MPRYQFPMVQYRKFLSSSISKELAAKAQEYAIIPGAFAPVAILCYQKNNDINASLKNAGGIIPRIVTRSFGCMKI